MNKIEHLLTTLSEECSEVAKEVSKGLRFGLDDGYPGKPKTNRETIVEEFNDLVAVMLMLRDEGVFTDDKLFNEEAIEAKIAKVEKYMLYAKEKGTLSDE